jgi:hypothetical protein
VREQTVFPNAETFPTIVLLSQCAQATSTHYRVFAGATMHALTVDRNAEKYEVGDNESACAPWRMP